MKKLIALTIALLLTFSLASCGGGSADPSPANDATVKKTEMNSGAANTPKATENNVQNQNATGSDAGITGFQGWVGVYTGDGFSLELSKSDEDGFWFEFFNMRDGSLMAAGMAVINPEDDYIAEYNDMMFSLYEDYSVIDVFVTEGAEWEHFSGQYSMLDPDSAYALDSQDDPQSDPGDDGLPIWLGSYTGDDFSIDISDCDGNNVTFALFLLRNGSMVVEGTAVIYPDNVMMAENDDLHFSLYEDFSGIDVLVAEDSEWEHVRGQYLRID